jgi:hypothetical protein
MAENLSVDLFGTLDTFPELWLPFLKEVRRDGVKVHVVTGPWPTETTKVLRKHGYVRDVHYDSTHSILHYLYERGQDTFYDEGDDSWYSHEVLWWESKAEICKQNQIKVHFDSDGRFRKHFDNVPTRFIFINQKVKDYIKKETILMESDCAWDDEDEFTCCGTEG